MKTLTLALVLFAFAPAVAQEKPADDPLKRLLAAWEVLEVSRDPAKAEPLFQKVYGDEEVPHAVRGRALAGLVRCSQLLGKKEEAAQRLRRLRENYADVPEVARSLAKLEGRRNGRTSYLSGIRWLYSEGHLDLDTGEMYGNPKEGLEPELRSSKNLISFLVEKHEAPGFAAKLAALSNAPWHRVETDRGRTSWVQVLRPGNPGALPIVRFVTRIGGKGEPGAAVRNLFAIGDGKSIRIHFEKDPACQEYRLERRDGGTGEYRVLGTTDRSSILDPLAVKGMRYAYRVTGIAKDGEEGIPAVTVGTIETRGISSGVLNVEPGKNHEVDFVLGRVVSKDGDLSFPAFAGNRAFIVRTHFGMVMPSLEPPDPAAAREMLPFDAGPPGTSSAIQPGRWYRIPLREGGVARFRCEIREEKGLRIRYEVNPDGPRFDAVPGITVSQAKNGVTFAVGAPEGYAVAELLVVDYKTGRTLTRLPVENGEARDTADRTGRVISYRATGEDRYGRRSATAEKTLNFLPPGILRGRFRFHYQDGWSFSRMAVVDRANADLSFERCAGGLSSITFRAPGGVTSLAKLDLEREKIPSVPALFNALVAADPAVIRLPQTASADSRDHRQDVFVMKTRDGKWVKFAVVYREPEGDWTKRMVSVTYVINPREPAFEKYAADHFDAGFHLRLPTLDEPTDPIPEVVEAQKKAEPILRELEDLDDRAAGMEAALRERLGMDVHVAALLSRSKARALGRHGAYRAATYSFEHATRDDEEDKARNDWDIQLTHQRGNLWVHVTMVTDDRSVIFDLGRVDFDEAIRNPPQGVEPAERMKLTKGHVYAIHTLDTESDYWSLFEVLEVVNGRAILFRWVKLRNPGPLEALQRVPEKFLRQPVVKLQLRGGAGGGNPNRVFMDGTKNAYVDEVSKTPLDLSGTIEIQERCRGYVEGGYIPTGMWFRIDEIEWKARVHGDSNGDGEFVLHAGPHRIAHIDEIHRKDQNYWLRTIDGGSERVSGGDMPITRRHAVKIYVSAGRESDVYAEIANSSACDVTLRGAFVQTADVPDEAIKLEKAPKWRLVRMLVDSLQEKDEKYREGVWYSIDKVGAELRPYVEDLLRQDAKEEYRALLKKMVERVRED